MGVVDKLGTSEGSALVDNLAKAGLENVYSQRLFFQISKRLSMKKYEYCGKMLTFKELLPLSVVPEKTLRSRLSSPTSIWTAESAVHTPFGKVGKTPEISKGAVDAFDNKQQKEITKKLAKSNNMQSAMRAHDKKAFTCVNCGLTKLRKLIGVKTKTGAVCTACNSLASKASSRTESEKNIKRGHYKEAAKHYKDGTAPLFFITNEDKYKK